MFGLPIFSDEVFSLNTQVVNHNIEGQIFQVRPKIEIDYFRAADLKIRLKPLLMAAATGLVLFRGQGDRRDPRLHLLAREGLGDGHCTAVQHRRTSPDGKLWNGRA